jgi:MFS family permease
LKHLPLNVWLLAITYALVMSLGATIVFIGGLAGADLAPVENLATLPVASLTIGTAATIVPVTMLMKRFGRKQTFIAVLGFSILVAFMAAYSIHIKSFYLFCGSIFLLGITAACMQQFRFAAMESVTPEFIPKAAASVLLGGIAAAYIGPEVALLGITMFETMYSGSFILLAGLFFIGLIIIFAFKNPLAEEKIIIHDARPLREISRQNIFWVAIFSAAIGYAVMSFIMTATPVSMHKMDGHSLSDTKWVIQSHIMAMFIPSIIAAWIIKKLGLLRMLLCGLLAYAVCIAIAFSGHSVIHYWLSLILLGVGWNFLFIGGTTLLPQVYRQQERFKVQAFNEFIVFGAQAVASLSAGWFVFALGWKLMLLLNIPFIIFMLIIIIRWKLRPSLQPDLNG